VAFAGATGSGKSSLFNKLSGLELAAVGVKHPTTAWTLACAWGPAGAGEILSWLGIPERYQVSRMSMLDGSPDDTQLQGLVLLDLPDHDSTEVSHHLEVDRLVRFADLLVWVLDPQKDADAAVHDRYLAPMASHSDVLLVVLNQIDQITAADRDSAVRDVRRLLEVDGLKDVPVMSTSALTEDGLDDLRRALVTRIRAKVGDPTCSAGPRRLGQLALRNLRHPGRTQHQHRSAGAHCTRPSLRRPVCPRSSRPFSGRSRHEGGVRRGGRSRAGGDGCARTRSQISGSNRIGSIAPGPRAVAVPWRTTSRRGRGGARDLCDGVGAGLTAPWRSAVRRASVSDTWHLHEAIERAVAATDLGVQRRPVWVLLVGALQWLLLATGIAGLCWIAALWVLGLGVSTAPDTPTLSGAALPNLMVLLGSLGGSMLGLVSLVLMKRSALEAARRADRELRASIADVVSSEVVAPIETSWPPTSAPVPPSRTHCAGEPSIHRRSCATPCGGRVRQQ